MAEPNLTESAWQKAKDDAWGVIKTPLFEIGGTMVGLVFGAAALIASEGQPGTTQAGASIFFGVLSVAVTLVFIFLVQLVAAPVRQRDELRGAWAAPAAQPKEIAVRLWNAYRKGCDLSTRMASRLPAEQDWQAGEAWAEETANLLAGNVPQETAREFFSAGSYESDLERQLDDRTEELKKIIEGLG